MPSKVNYQLLDISYTFDRQIFSLTETSERTLPFTTPKYVTDQNALKTQYDILRYIATFVWQRHVNLHPSSNPCHH